MGTSCLSETKGRSCWGFVDRVTFHRYLLRKREGCSGDGAEEEEGAGMHYAALPHCNPFSPLPKKQLLEKSHGGTKWECTRCEWLYPRKNGWVEERKEVPESSAHETKAKAGPALTFLSFLVARQPQLRCNGYPESCSCACQPATDVPTLR